MILPYPARCSSLQPARPHVTKQDEGLQQPTESGTVSYEPKIAMPLEPVRSCRESAVTVLRGSVVHE